MTEYISPTENDPVDAAKEAAGKAKEDARQEAIRKGDNKGKK